MNVLKVSTVCLLGLMTYLAQDVIVNGSNLQAHSFEAWETGGIFFLVGVYAVVSAIALVKLKKKCATN